MARAGEGVVPTATGPRSPTDSLKDKLKDIEKGKLSRWIFIYPLHGIKLGRWVIDKFEEEKKYDIGFITPQGLTSDDMRFIASRLIAKADFIENLPPPSACGQD